MHDIFLLHVKLITYNIIYCIFLPIVYLLHNPRLRKTIVNNRSKQKNENEIKAIFMEKQKLEKKITLTRFTSTTFVPD